MRLDPLTAAGSAKEAGALTDDVFVHGELGFGGADEDGDSLGEVESGPKVSVTVCIIEAEIHAWFEVLG